MLWLLLDRNRAVAGMDYWEQIQANLNLEPMSTINRYWNILRNPDYYKELWGAYSVWQYYTRHAFVNLFGNVGMFIPLGFFLPLLWRGMRKWWRTWLATALTVTAVELTQLFSLRGTCDVDDLILNLLGAAVGYILFWAALKIWKDKLQDAQSS